MDGSQKLRMSRINRGQAMVEFALVSTLVLAVMLVGVQFALIGQVALALSQGSSALARYAAVNPGSFGTNNGTATLPAAASALLSPTINDGNLTVTINSYTSTGAKETGTPVTSVDQVVVNLSYNAASKIALPNPFLGLVNFPTSLTASDAELYE